METCPRIPMLSFDQKICNAEINDFTGKIYNYIYSHYQENPESFKKEINELTQLRENAVNSSKDFMGLNILKNYYHQLHFISNRFPMKAGEEVEAEFSWENLYNQKELSHNDIRFEQECILYNIGAMHSYLGCLDSRKNDDGIKISCTHFQYAAWAFRTIRETYSANEFTSDLNEDILTFKINSMLAQAQECVLEKSIIDNRKTSINAKISAQIVDFYQLALTNLEKLDSQKDIDSKIKKDWKSYCQFKISYYTAVWNYFSAIFSADQQKYGDSVGYSQVAEAKITECSKMKNFKELQDTLKFTIECIETKSKLLKKDNDFVYNEKITAKENLPEVKGVSLVKSLPIDFESVETQDIFIRLVSMKAHELSSMYSEEKAKCLRQINDQVEEKDAQLKQFLTALQIDQLHLDNFDYLKLPKQLLECCASISVRPNLLTEEIPAAVKSLRDASVQAEEIIGKIEEEIEREEKEHRKENAENGHQSDESLTDSSDESDNESTNKSRNKPAKSARKMKLKEFSKRYDHLSKYFLDANNSNNSLFEESKSILNNLQVLSLPLAELTKKLPEIETVNSEESKEIRDKLVSLLEKVDEMKSQRQELLKRFQRAIQDDDLTKTIASRQNEISDANEFFQEQIKKHEQLTTYLNQNLQAQDNILRALADSNASFTTDRQQILQATQQRNAFIDGLVFSYQSSNDLVEQANKGVLFYENLIKPLNLLLKDVHEFCKKSEEERKNRNFVSRFKPARGPLPNNFPQNHFSSANAPQLPINNHISPEVINPETMANLNLNNERPKLKDFLPFMKPQSWGGGKNEVTKVKPKSTGPPVVDRSNFSNQNFPQQNNQHHQQNLAQQTQQYYSPHPQMNIPTPNIPLQIQPNMTQVPHNVTHPKPSFPQRPQLNMVPPSQYHVPQAQASQLPQENQVRGHEFPPNENKQIPTMNTNIQTIGPNPNFNQTQNGSINQNYSPNMNQNIPSSMPQSNDPQHSILIQKQLEQQIKEKELSIKKQQLEQQEKQFKLQQQQFMLEQQRQQQIMVEQQNRQQQQLLIDQQKQKQLILEKEKSQHNQQQTHHQNQFTNQQLQNPQYSIHSQNQEYNKNLQNQAQIPQNNPNFDQYNRIASNLNHNQFSLNQFNTVQQPPQLPTQQTPKLPTLSQITNNNKEFKPQSVYKPGNINQYQIDQMKNQVKIEPTNLYKPINQPQMYPNVTSNINQNNPVQTISNAVTNINQSNIPPKIYQPPAQTLTINPQQTMNKVTPQVKPSAIDDLLDIFDGSNFDNSQILMPIIPKVINEQPQIQKEVKLPVYHEPKISDSKLEEATFKKSIIEEQNTTKSEGQPELYIQPIKQAQSMTNLNFLNNPSMLENFVNCVQKLEHHVNILNNKTLASTTLLEKEWKELNEYQEKHSSSMTISVARCYPKKNRFQDLLPFDQTRIVIRNKNNDDYINATNMGKLCANDSRDNLHGQPNFLISQAPILTNTSDLFNFWTMIVQQQVELVCCLSRDSEMMTGATGSKSFPSFYWPVSKETPLDVMSLRISLLHVKETPVSIKRICSIANTVDSTQKIRTVVLLQHKYGPNTTSLRPPQSSGIGLNEMPENVVGFLKYIKECTQFYTYEQRNSQNPVLVHCMNGVSRSAVFLVIYTLIQIVDYNCDESMTQISNIPDSVIRLIKQMREKRKYMVQSMYHLKYSYEAVLYYLKDIMIKQGILTSQTSKNTDGVEIETQTSEAQKCIRQNSIEIASNILNDSSLVSIQDSTQTLTAVEKPQIFETNLSQQMELDSSLPKPSLISVDDSNQESQHIDLRLEDLCDPNKFKLDFADDGTKRKQKITKNDFLKAANISPSITRNNPDEKLNDPFSSLDPLRKQ